MYIVRVNICFFITMILPELVLVLGRNTLVALEPEIIYCAPIISVKPFGHAGRYALAYKISGSRRRSKD